MVTFDWSPDHSARLAAIRDDLAQVSTATAFQLLMQQGWRNTYMKGLRPSSSSAWASGSSGGRAPAGT